MMNIRRTFSLLFCMLFVMRGKCHAIIKSNKPLHRKTITIKTIIVTLLCSLRFLTAYGQITQTELQKILADDGTTGDSFGYSVSISGDRAIVGVRSNGGADSNRGSAYIFERDASGTWQQVSKLKPIDESVFSGFDFSVSISGDRAIVGSVFNGTTSVNINGAAFIFERDVSGTWQQVSKLTASDGASNDFFGFSVSISGERAIVGALRDDDKGLNSGSAYIFERDASGNWQETKLNASDGGFDDAFGRSVSISGECAIVGRQSGSAYIFERNASGNWQETQLRASGGFLNDFFGFSVSISGDRAIVGARNDDSAYIFERNASGTWQQVSKLTAIAGGNGDAFGISVSISGDRAIVGAFWDEDNGFDSGSAYIFERDASGTWQQVSKLTARDGTSGDLFGFSVSISGDHSIVGAPYDDDKGNDSGSAYFYQVAQDDTEKPIIAQPNPITANTDEGICTASVAFSATVSDNVDSDIIPVFSREDGTEITSPYVFPKGETIVKVNAIDAAGNNADEVSFTVTVTDNEAPTALAQAITIQLDASGNASFSASQIDNGSTDNCDNSPTLAVSPASFTCANVGKNTVTLMVTDEAGNSSSATTTVTVEDKQAPEPNVAALPDLEIQLNEEITDFPTATDNCSGEIVATTDNELSYGESGIYKITWVYSDDAGNTSTQDQVVTVEPAAVVASLNLTSECSDNPDLERIWRLTNPNDFDVDYTYLVVGTDQTKTLVATPGLSYFTTQAIKGPNTTKIFWEDENGQQQENVKASGGAACNPNLTFTTTEGSCEFAPSDLPVDLAEVVAFAPATYANFTRNRGTYVVGVIAGMRNDGRPGAWEIHNDCTIKPLRQGARKNDSELPNNSHSGLNYDKNWRFNITDISSDGGTIFANAINDQGYQVTGGQCLSAGAPDIGPGTIVPVSWKLSESPFYGRIKGATLGYECEVIQFNCSNGYIIGCGSSAARIATTTSDQDPGDITAKMSLFDVAKFDFYPNPINGNKLYLESESKHEVIRTLSFINYLGKIVLQKSIQVLSGHHRQEIDIQELPSGQYILILRSSKGVKSIRKIIKN